MRRKNGKNKYIFSRSFAQNKSQSCSTPEFSVLTITRHSHEKTLEGTKHVLGDRTCKKKIKKLIATTSPVLMKHIIGWECSRRGSHSKQFILLAPCYTSASSVLQGCSCFLKGQALLTKQRQKKITCLCEKEGRISI